MRQYMFISMGTDGGSETSLTNCKHDLKSSGDLNHTKVNQEHTKQINMLNPTYL